MTFSSTFRPESRLYSWTTKPTRREPDREDGQVGRDEEQGRLPRGRGCIDDDRDRRPDAVAQQASDESYERCLEQELAHHVDRRRADRLLQADLAHALGHRHEHRVHHRQAADDQRQQRGRSRDRGEDRTAGLEAVDQRAGSDRLDPGDLGVDLVGDLVQLADRRARFGVDVDRLGDLGDVDLVADRRGQAVLQQHLAVRDADIGKCVGCGAGGIEDPYHLERVVDEVGLSVGWPDRQVDCVADLLVELLVDGRAEDDFTLRVGVDGVALRVGRREGAPRVLRRVAGDDLVRYAEADCRDLPWLGCKTVAGECRGHARHLFDLVDLARGKEGGRLAVGRTHLDAAAEVLHAAVDQRIEVLGERAHRRQGEHPDEDARDGQEAAQLVARDVTDDFHGGPLRIPDDPVDGGLRISSRRGPALRTLSCPRREETMSDLEQILKKVDFFKPVATRRGFMQKLALAGGAAAAGAIGLGKVTNVFADSATDFVTAAVGAERIGIAFYGNAIGSGSLYSASGDAATNTLLHSPP